MLRYKVVTKTNRVLLEGFCLPDELNDIKKVYENTNFMVCVCSKTDEIVNHINKKARC